MPKGSRLQMGWPGERDPNDEVLEPGSILASPVSALRLIVLCGSSDAHRLAADGADLVRGYPPPCSCDGNPDDPGSTVVWGARYRDDRSGIEVRCLVPAGRTLNVDGREMRIQHQVPPPRIGAVTRADVQR